MKKPIRKVVVPTSRPKRRFPHKPTKIIESKKLRRQLACGKKDMAE